MSILRYGFQGNPESWTDFINLAEDEERNRVIVASAIKSSRNMGSAVLTGTIAHAKVLQSLVKSRGESLFLRKLLWAYRPTRECNFYSKHRRASIGQNVILSKIKPEN